MNILDKIKDRRVYTYDTTDTPEVDNDFLSEVPIHSNQQKEKTSLETMTTDKEKLQNE